MKKILPDKLEELLLVFFLGTMTIVLGMQIVSRYIVGNSLSWSEELVRYLFIWSAFIGVPYCIKLGSSLKVLKFIEFLPMRLQKTILFIDRIILFLFFMLMLYFSIMVVRESFVSGQTSPALGVPIWLVYLSVVVGSFLSVCRVVEKIIESANNVDSKADSF